MKRPDIAVTVGAFAIALAGVLMPATPAAAAGPEGGESANDTAVVIIAPPPTRLPEPGTRVGGYGAQHQDGVCHQYSNGFGDLCLWYLQNFGGSLVDLFVNDCNLSDNTFITAGTGQGQTVANDAESDWNYDLVHTARLWTSANCTGTPGEVLPGTGGNLGAGFRNNVEGFYFY